MKYIFRAKDKRGDWYEGAYFEHINRQICPIGDSLKERDYTHIIIESGFADWNMTRPIVYHEVIAETVSQYTEFNVGHKKIFGKDILEFDCYDELLNRPVMLRGFVKMIKGEWKVVVHDEDCDVQRHISLSYACRDGGNAKIIGNTVDDTTILNTKTEQL